MIRSDEDEKYILNLTAHTVRGNVLGSIPLDKRGDLSAKRIHRILIPLITPALKEMTNETLGRISGFATPHGKHGRGRFVTKVHFFRHNTGLADLPPLKLSPLSSPYREVMEEVAAHVIICVARDIRLQHKWLREAGVPRGLWCAVSNHDHLAAA